ncbi:hypothetical protein CPB86DRAFT_791945, partial [Serendipita vermifera]
HRKVTSSTVNKDAAARGESDSPTFPNADEYSNIQRNDSKGLEGDERQPNHKSCQENARVWGLYLKKVNFEGQELTTLWNNGLDSLLIFPRRISLPVLTKSNSRPVCNRVEISKRTHKNDHFNIRSILMNEPVLSASDFQHPSSLHANARGTAVSRSPSSFSLLLLLVGLVIQIWDNDARIWVITLILTIVATLLYITFTFFPSFFPGFPFQTPITGILEGSVQARRSKFTANQTAPFAKVVFLEGFDHVLLERRACIAKENGDGGAYLGVDYRELDRRTN